MGLDFRSDTITLPTDAMRHAMATAEVGDDVFGEDPTVARLEEEAARRLGMDAGLFVPSGTMANQVAVMTHTKRRGQVLLEENCHIALYEGGAASLLSGVMVRGVRAERGVFGPADMERHFLPDDPHFAQTKLVCIENTHNWAGGTCWKPDEVRAVVEAAHARGAAVHVDGARIWNAAVALDVPAAQLVQGADSVMFCLSKGLSAPVGSVLCGSEAFIEAARHDRKILGGGMRQAGVIAAAGLVALDEMVERLKEDHDNARSLGFGLRKIPGLKVQMPETNIVYVDVAGLKMPGGPMDAPRFCAWAQEQGISVLPRDAGTVVRFVIHRHVSADDVEEASTRLGMALETQVA